MKDLPSVIPPGARQLTPEERSVLMTEMEEIVEASRLFRSLDVAGRQQVLQSGYVCSFEMGEVVLRQGATGSIMYLILRGRVSVKTEVEGKEVVLAELSRDACVGEVSVLTGGPRTATVTALENVDAVAFEQHRIERVLLSYPDVRKMLETIIEGRAADTVAKIIG